MNMSGKTQVAKNLEWLIAKFQTNPNALQLATKVPQPTIFRILNGQSLDPKSKTLKPLANFFGVSVADMREKDLSASDGPQPVEDDKKVIEGDVVKSVIENPRLKEKELSRHVRAMLTIMDGLNDEWQSKAVAAVQAWLMVAGAEEKEQQQKVAGRTGTQ